jgi:glycosyltransferase involved in cell wall biosynthesis
VAGRNPSETLRRRFRHLEDVEFTGSVPDIRREIARAAVCVVPLRIGSGTRLKILEAAAMEKAVVSTTLGAEGLDFQSGREIMLADEPGAFAEEVAALLQDGGRRSALGAAAHRRVEARYSLPVLQQAVARALDELLGARAGAGASR